MEWSLMSVSSVRRLCCPCGAANLARGIYCGFASYADGLGVDPLHDVSNGQSTLQACTSARTIFEALHVAK